jgi:hypothetical protein
MTTSRREADMVWAVLVLVAVPSWLCALGVIAVVFRTRALRRHPGNFPVQVLRLGHNRWTSGHEVLVPTVDQAALLGPFAADHTETARSAVQLISPTLPTRRGTGRPWT